MKKRGIRKKIISNIIVLIITLTVLFELPIETFATETFEEDGVTATLSYDGTLTITGSGKLNQSLIRKFKYATGIKKVAIEEGVTSIGYDVFYECVSLRSIEIPSSVTSISDSIDNECSSLQEIKVNTNNENYSSENGILFNKDKTRILCYPEGKTETSYTIPSSVTSIASTAFENCSSLKNIQIPSSVTSIGDNAFDGCSSLQSIEIPRGVTSIEYCTFFGCKSLKSIEIPSSVTSIGSKAFYRCSSLQSIEIPSSVASISYSAFDWCSSLQEIKVNANNENYSSENGILFNKDKTAIIKYPEGKTETSYTIPSSVTSIASTAFENCSSLKNIQIPSSVTSIGSKAFYRCSSLQSIEIPSGVTSIEGQAFEGCSSLQSVEIPSSVASISYSAFDGCSSLQSVEIPSGVTSIGSTAFENCSSLKNIQIPSSVTSIGDSAFYGCNNLRSIAIPNSVTSIGNNAFWCSIYSYIENENSMEIEIPDIIKRAIAEEDILYSNKLICTNCELDKSRNKVLLDKDKIIKEGARIRIDQGALEGLNYYINYRYRDISKNEDGSVVANFDEEEGTITVRGTGQMKSGSLGGFITDTAIKKVTIEDGVINIGTLAFSECRNLSSIEIPSSVTSIGYDVFDRCSSLQEIKVDENNENYINENGILFNKDKTKIICYPAGKNENNYTIPNGVTSIYNSAFNTCSSLKNIEIPSSVTSIGDKAFDGCSSLQSIEIPSSVTYIASQAFSGCSSLQSVEIPSSVTSIENYAFSGCSSLQSIEISSGVTSIGTNAFSGCSNLRSIAIPNSVTSIENYAFYGCSNLRSIAIPNSVTSIGSNALTACNYLTMYCQTDSAAQNYAKENDISYIIDDAEPKIEGTSANWVKSDVTIVIEDDVSGLKEVTINGEKIEIGEDGKVTCTISTNGEWEVVAKDYVENTSRATVKIDNIQPSINVSGNLTQETIKGVTLTVNATDSLSGIPTQNAYSFDGGETWQTSNTKTYNKNATGIKIKVKDNAGNIGEYETIDITNIRDRSDIIEISGYTLENNMVKGVQPNTTLTKLKEYVKIYDSTKVQILNKQNQELSNNDIITTGSKIQINAYGESLEYIIVVTGDTTGDGQADIKDILSMNKHRLNKTRLEGEYLVAGDVNKDGIVDIRDILQVNKFRLGKIKTL